MQKILEDIPKNSIELEDEFCSNFDGIINTETVKELKASNSHANYPGWDFHGTVWYDNQSNHFKCKIMCYRSHVDTITAETPEDLKEAVCENYGYK